MTRSVTSRIPAIGIAHPRIGRGGSEGALMWAVDALCREYRVNLITTGDVDIAALNDHYGTTVPPDAVGIDRAPLPAWLARCERGAALRGYWHQRHARNVAGNYDVLFSAYNLCDFGCRAIQRIADFSWAPDVRASVDPESTGSRAFHQTRFLNRIYLGVCRRIAPPSGRDLFRDDMLIANSKWTASILRDTYHATNVRVIYPPVPGDFPDVPWEQRAPDFIFMGRIAKEKRVEVIIDILERVRGLGHPAHLHVIGPAGTSSYARDIVSRMRARPEWVHHHGELRGEEKGRLLASCRYGIHACPFEGFGIAVAEMVRAGCLPFVPSSGGVAEIVGHAQELCWSRTDEAVARIDALLRSAEQTATLRESLASRARAFPIAAYQQAILDVVRDLLEGE